jgi:hypothetical protein
VVAGAAAGFQQGPAAGFPPVALGIASIVFLPAFYGVMGFVGGMLTAALYNLAARIMGGIEIDISE